MTDILMPTYETKYIRCVRKLLIDRCVCIIRGPKCPWQLQAEQKTLLQWTKRTPSEIPLNCHLKLGHYGAAFNTLNRGVTRAG